MNKRIKNVVGYCLAFIIIICVIGCGDVSASYTDDDILVPVSTTTINNAYAVYEVKDIETGVHYFVKQYGSVMPRYNADGSLYVD